MSEFHRMITYLYLYEGNHKTHNTGFAKIEKRDRRCLVEIHMKNTGHSQPDLPVYFYTRNNKSFPGILLGHLNLFHGSGDFKEILDAENLAGTGCSLADVKGIYLPLTETSMLLSQWDDRVFCREDFTVTPNHITADAATPKPVADVESSGKNVNRPADFSEPCPELNTTSESLLEYASRAILNSVPSCNPQPIPSSDAASEAASAPSSVEPDLKAAEAAPTSSSISESIDGKENWLLKWQFILENFPVMTPFAGDENTTCVRLELKDLRLLPKSFWYLGNNSFLLHGFFNYRHLLLGLKKKEGEKHWFLGTPGIFQNPERVMAALFGFTEFSSEKPSDLKTGSFGYWLRYLSN